MSQGAPPNSDAVPRPPWFDDFLTDRGTRKPSAHTLKAYRQDFDAISAHLLANGTNILASPSEVITMETMRAAFAGYAKNHEAASIQRCWSTWNTLCTFLYTSQRLTANPMPLVGRPKAKKTLPKALPTASVEALVAGIDTDEGHRPSDWKERDRALILTSLLAGLRTEELQRANIADVRRTDDGAVIHVRGKGGKDRRVPIEPALVAVLDTYLDSRAVRFPDKTKRRSSGATGLSAWPATAPLFVGPDGDRITRGTLQYRVLRAFRRAGIDADRARGALTHGLRHTFATELAQGGISVYALMKLLGHESLVTSQRYITAAGTETREAASQNRLYTLLEQAKPDQ